MRRTKFNKKRLISGVLAISMALSMAPVSAFAETGSGSASSDASSYSYGISSAPDYSKYTAETWMKLLYSDYYTPSIAITEGDSLKLRYTTDGNNYEMNIGSSTIPASSVLNMTNKDIREKYSLVLSSIKEGDIQSFKKDVDDLVGDPTLGTEGYVSKPEKLGDYYKNLLYSMYVYDSTIPLINTDAQFQADDAVHTGNNVATLDSYLSTINGLSDETIDGYSDEVKNAIAWLKAKPSTSSEKSRLDLAKTYYSGINGFVTYVGAWSFLENTFGTNVGHSSWDSYKKYVDNMLSIDGEVQKCRDASILIEYLSSPYSTAKHLGCVEDVASFESELQSNLKILYDNGVVTTSPVLMNVSFSVDENTGKLLTAKSNFMTAYEKMFATTKTITLSDGSEDYISEIEYAYMTILGKHARTAVATTDRVDFRDLFDISTNIAHGDELREILDNGDANKQSTWAPITGLKSTWLNREVTQFMPITRAGLTAYEKNTNGFFEVYRNKGASNMISGATPKDLSNPTHPSSISLNNNSAIQDYCMNFGLDVSSTKLTLDSATYTVSVSNPKVGNLFPIVTKTVSIKELENTNFADIVEEYMLKQLAIISDGSLDTTLVENYVTSAFGGDTDFVFNGTTKSKKLSKMCYNAMADACGFSSDCKFIVEINYNYSGDAKFDAEAAKQDNPAAVGKIAPVPEYSIAEYYESLKDLPTGQEYYARHSSKVDKYPKLKSLVTSSNVDTLKVPVDIPVNIMNYTPAWIAYYPTITTNKTYSNGWQTGSPTFTSYYGKTATKVADDNNPYAVNIAEWSGTSESLTVQPTANWNVDTTSYGMTLTDDAAINTYISLPKAAAAQALGTMKNGTPEYKAVQRLADAIDHSKLTNEYINANNLKKDSNSGNDFMVYFPEYVTPALTWDFSDLTGFRNLRSQNKDASVTYDLHTWISKNSEEDGIYVADWVEGNKLPEIFSGIIDSTNTQGTSGSDSHVKSEYAPSTEYGETRVDGHTVTLGDLYAEAKYKDSALTESNFLTDYVWCDECKVALKRTDVPAHSTLYYEVVHEKGWATKAEKDSHSGEIKFDVEYIAPSWQSDLEVYSLDVENPVITTPEVEDFFEIKDPYADEVLKEYLNGRTPVDYGDRDFGEDENGLPWEVVDSVFSIYGHVIGWYKDQYDTGKRGLGSGEPYEEYRLATGYGDYKKALQEAGLSTLLKENPDPNAAPKAYIDWIIANKDSLIPKDNFEDGNKLEVPYKWEVWINNNTKNIGNREFASAVYVTPGDDTKEENPPDPKENAPTKKTGEAGGITVGRTFYKYADEFNKKGELYTYKIPKKSGKYHYSTSIKYKTLERKEIKETTEVCSAIICDDAHDDVLVLWKQGAFGEFDWRDLEVSDYHVEENYVGSESNPVPGGRDNGGVYEVLLYGPTDNQTETWPEWNEDAEGHFASYDEFKEKVDDLKSSYKIDVFGTINTSPVYEKNETYENQYNTLNGKVSQSPTDINPLSGFGTILKRTLTVNGESVEPSSISDVYTPFFKEAYDASDCGCPNSSYCQHDENKCSYFSAKYRKVTKNGETTVTDSGHEVTVKDALELRQISGSKRYGEEELINKYKTEHLNANWFKLENLDQMSGLWKTEDGKYIEIPESKLPSNTVYGVQTLVSKAKEAMEVTNQGTAKFSTTPYTYSFAGLLDVITELSDVYKLKDKNYVVTSDGTLNPTRKDILGFDIGDSKWQSDYTTDANTYNLVPEVLMTYKTGYFDASGNLIKDEKQRGLIGHVYVAGYNMYNMQFPMYNTVDIKFNPVQTIVNANQATSTNAKNLSKSNKNLPVYYTGSEANVTATDANNSVKFTSWVLTFRDGSAEKAAAAWNGGYDNTAAMKAANEWLNLYKGTDGDEKGRFKASLTSTMSFTTTATASDDINKKQNHTANVDGIANERIQSTSTILFGAENASANAFTKVESSFDIKIRNGRLVSVISNGTEYVITGDDGYGCATTEEFKAHYASSGMPEEIAEVVANMKLCEFASKTLAHNMGSENWNSYNGLYPYSDASGNTVGKEINKADANIPRAENRNWYGEDVTTLRVNKYVLDTKLPSQLNSTIKIPVGYGYKTASDKSKLFSKALYGWVEMGINFETVTNECKGTGIFNIIGDELGTATENGFTTVKAEPIFLISDASVNDQY